MKKIFMLAFNAQDSDYCNSLSVRPPVCLSHGSTRLHCAKTAEQIKIIFMLNTFGGPRNIVLDGDTQVNSGVCSRQLSPID